MIPLTNEEYVSIKSAFSALLEVCEAECGKKDNSGYTKQFIVSNPSALFGVEEWAAQKLEDEPGGHYNVPGVERRIRMARAVIAGRAAFARLDK